jgi:hypothetical protein
MVHSTSNLEELDRFRLDQSDDCMMLTKIDGFLAGINVCPDLIPIWFKVDDLAGHRVHGFIAFRGELHRVFCR